MYKTSSRSMDIDALHTYIYLLSLSHIAFFVEFATPRVTQNIVILLYYSTLHIQMQLNQQRNGRKKYVFVNLR